MKHGNKETEKIKENITSEKKKTTQGRSHQLAPTRGEKIKNQLPNTSKKKNSYSLLPLIEFFIFFIIFK